MKLCDGELRRCQPLPIIVAANGISLALVGVVLWFKLREPGTHAPAAPD
jgi:hypothetical protein